MIVFDVGQPPPTRQQLEAENKLLAVQKKRLVKASIISDGVHGLIFLALYLTHLLTGYALLVAIGVGTVVAVVLASTLKKQLRKSDIALVILVSLAAIAAVCGILIGVMHEAMPPGIFAGLMTGSMVIAGAMIGRRFFHVFSGLENLKYVAEDEYAEQELLALCNRYPELEYYRQQARDLLRPNLNFGELQAMRDWLRR